MNFKGYKGSFLKVDLSRGKVIKENLDKKFAQLYLGGRGFNSKLLFDKVNPAIKPFHPENLIVLSVGPLTGTLAPTSGRYHISAKSPLTGIMGYGNAGGFFGSELKYAGFDGLLITGKSKNPVYLSICDGEAEIRDASFIWSRNTFETEKLVKENLSDKEVRVLSIGQAGENLVKFAAVINDNFRAAARTGVGAVMGSKKLKAIAVKGTGKVEVAYPEKFIQTVEETFQKIYEDPAYPSLSTYGTPFLVDLAQESGGLATRNNQTGVFEKYEEISSHLFREKNVVKSEACSACPIHCGKYASVREGKYAGVKGGGPEYETVVCLGSKIGVGNLEAIMYFNLLANMYGLDTISLGDSIAFAMELFEKGIIDEKDTEGLKLTWGNEEAVTELIKQIVSREKFGNILAEGVKKAASIIGRGAEKYALHVKGLEPPAYEIRTAKAFGLGWAVATRGADHLAALPNFELLGYPPEVGIKWFGTPKVVDPYAIEGKPLMVVWHENFAAAIDSAILCKYSTFSTYAVKPKDLANLLTFSTGWKYTGNLVLEIGERIYNIEKLFNLREGVGKEEDKLPSRFTHEPLPEGPGKGQVVELDEMLPEYYRIRGWNPETSYPTPEKLRQLKLMKEGSFLNKERVEVKE